MVADRRAVLPLSEDQRLREGAIKTGAGGGWGVSCGFGPRRGSKTVRYEVFGVKRR